MPAALRGLMYLSPPFCLLVDAIVGRNNDDPPRDATGSDWSESLYKNIYDVKFMTQLI